MLPRMLPRPLGSVVADQARTAIVGPIAADFELELVFAPPWTPEDLSDAGRERLA
jgi:metal-sulfur cluster biosynthetic enzyme